MGEKRILSRKDSTDYIREVSSSVHILALLLSILLGQVSVLIGVKLLRCSFPVGQDLRVVQQVLGCCSTKSFCDSATDPHY